MPYWNKANNCFCMRFSEKTVLPSVKNTILVDEDDMEVLKFYKNSYLTYNLTF